jgi:HPt (histidine-containing phosphotransfer) domain-containing protein
MDYKALASNLGLEENEYFEMLDLFVEVSLSDINRLEAGLKEANSEGVLEAAHSIKGAAINLGLKEFADLAMAVEMKARDKDLDGAPEAAMKIRELLGQLEDSTEQFKIS